MQGSNNNNDDNNNNSNNDYINNNNTNIGSRPACASCKHQRKRCDPNCMLAPLFPADKNRDFQAVHKVFGVSNVTKMVRNVREEERKDVAESLIWEANCRQNDPVLGTLGEYRRIEEQLRRLESQMNQNSNHNHNQNQPVQLNVQPRGTPMYNPHGWNNVGTTNNIGMHLKGTGVGGGLVANNNLLNFSHDNGAMMLDQFTGYPAQNFVQRQEISNQENISASRLPLQQNQHHHLNGFNQSQFYHPGPFDSNNGKFTDNTQWQARQ